MKRPAERRMGIHPRMGEESHVRSGEDQNAGGSGRAKGPRTAVRDRPLARGSEMADQVHIPQEAPGPAGEPAGAKAGPQFGLTAAMALIVGSIIGVGVFNLPTSLAGYGPITLVSMALTTVGALALAMLFAALSRRLPADGGPAAYARARV